MAIWMAIIIPALWVTRGRRPSSQLFGYILILLASNFVLRNAMALDRSLADPLQFLTLGVGFGCLGLGSRQWFLFLYLGLVMILLSWPVAIAARQTWFDPYGSVLLGASQGLVLIAFGVTYLFFPPARSGQHSRA